LCLVEFFFLNYSARALLQTHWLEQGLFNKRVTLAVALDRDMKRGGVLIAGQELRSMYRISSEFHLLKSGLLHIGFECGLWHPKEDHLRFCLKRGLLNWIKILDLAMV
jgi:hypothetical protein